MSVSIRLAQPADAEVMQRIEVDAGERFREIGLDAIADDAPPDTAILLAHVGDGTAWVAVDAGAPSCDRLIGFALASEVDGEGHIDQVSVLGSRAGEGLGRRLLQAVEEWAIARGFGAMTLTTFCDVAWNGPYYRRLGYVDLEEAELHGELAAIRARERALGLDVAPRVAMRKPLTSA